MADIKKRKLKQGLKQGDAHTCEQFDEVCAERDTLEAQLRAREQALENTRIDLSEWKVALDEARGLVMAKERALERMRGALQHLYDETADLNMSMQWWPKGRADAGGGER